jgi:26S proteasome regulatory subunit N9
MYLQVILEDLEAADTCVHSAYHLLASEYYKGVGPPESFFRSALMYIAYTPLEGMSPERQYQLATDIRYTIVYTTTVYCCCMLLYY